MAHVLDIAREQFSDLGYRAVTMRQVADKARVSTRTLYNRYADKLSLFIACLDSGATAFPRIQHTPDIHVGEALRRYAVAVVRVLSTDSSVRLGMLVYREGSEFPELQRAAEANQHRYLVEPLAAYLRDAGLSEADEDDRAKVFIAMAISEWQRSVSFRRPLPSEEKLDRHAALVVRLFLNGAMPAARIDSSCGGKCTRSSKLSDLQQQRRKDHG
jgi:TetR/AcrR family transcriptional repressor of mexJK operon